MNVFLLKLIRDHGPYIVVHVFSYLESILEFIFQLPVYPRLVLLLLTTTTTGNFPSSNDPSCRLSLL